MRCSVRLGCFFRSLRKELVRLGVQAAHAAHDERDEVTLRHMPALGILHRALAALVADGMLKQGLERKHGLLHERTNADIDPRGSLCAGRVDELVVRPLPPRRYRNFLRREKTWPWFPG